MSISFYPVACCIWKALGEQQMLNAEYACRWKSWGAICWFPFGHMSGCSIVSFRLICTVLTSHSRFTVFPHFSGNSYTPFTYSTWTQINILFRKLKTRHGKGINRNRHRSAPPQLADTSHRRNAHFSWRRRQCSGSGESFSTSVHIKYDLLKTISNASRLHSFHIFKADQTIYWTINKIKWNNWIIRYPNKNTSMHSFSLQYYRLFILCLVGLDAFARGGGRVNLRTTLRILLDGAKWPREGQYRDERLPPSRRTASARRPRPLSVELHATALILVFFHSRSEGTVFQDYSLVIIYSHSYIFTFTSLSRAINLHYLHINIQWCSNFRSNVLENPRVLV